MNKLQVAYKKAITSTIESTSTKEYLLKQELAARFLKTVQDKDGNIQVVRKTSHTKRYEEEVKDDDTK